MESLTQLKCIQLSLKEQFTQHMKILPSFTQIPNPFDLLSFVHHKNLTFWILFLAHSSMQLQWICSFQRDQNLHKYSLTIFTFGVLFDASGLQSLFIMTACKQSIIFMLQWTNKGWVYNDNLNFWVNKSFNMFNTASCNRKKNGLF